MGGTYPSVGNRGSSPEREVPGHDDRVVGGLAHSYNLLNLSTKLTQRTKTEFPTAAYRITFLQERRFLLELLSELSELLPQIGDLLLKVCHVTAKCGDLLLQLHNPFPAGGCGSELRLRCRLCFQLLDVAREQVCVA